MHHVLVESNWLVGHFAPAHHRMPGASELLNKTSTGEVRLYVPALCITEAKRAIQTRFQPRREADAIRGYLRWSMDHGETNAADAAVTRRLVQRFEQQVEQELKELPNRLAELNSSAGVEVFALDDSMLRRSVQLAPIVDLKPFDHAVLAAVLVRAERLIADGAGSVSFCELDSDLQPWDKSGKRKDWLADLYDAARVWVYGDFVMTRPERPDPWEPSTGRL